MQQIGMLHLSQHQDDNIEGQRRDAVDGLTGNEDPAWNEVLLETAY